MIFMNLFDENHFLRLICEANDRKAEGFEVVFDIGERRKPDEHQ